MAADEAQARALMRVVPNWPKPGITFLDASPLYANPAVFEWLVAECASRVAALKASVVAGLDARGFILGAAVAIRLGLGFLAIRKAGKLPQRADQPLLRKEYTLEYGTASLEVNGDDVVAGTRYALVDDLLATGGTLAAACDLIDGGGGVVAGSVVLVELESLSGRDKIGGSVSSILRY